MTGTWTTYMMTFVLAGAVAFAGADGPFNVGVPMASGPGGAATVRELVHGGQAKFAIVEKRVFTERTEVELVLTDPSGKTIGGLATPYVQDEEDVRLLWKDFVTANLAIAALPDQISVREERKAEKESFAVAFALDHSPSMTMPRAIRMQKAVQQALATFDVNDYASVVKFTSRVSTEVSLSRDKEEVMKSFKVNGINLRSDGTAIYDGAMEALDELSQAQDVSKRILILFTDGEDNSSSATLNDVLARAKELDVRIFPVAYGVSDDAPLYTMAEKTGGRLHRLHDVYDFDRVFLGIYAALRHSYIVSVRTTKQRNDDMYQGAVISAGGMSAGSVRSAEVMNLMPKSGVEIASLASTDQSLVLNVDLDYDDESSDVDVSDVPMLDSVATMLIQRSDLALEIASGTDVTGASAEQVKSAQKRAQVVRDLLIRRGVPPARVQGYAGRSQAAPNHRPPGQKTTFVITKL